MATALSPTVSTSRKGAEPITAKKFSELIEYFKTSFKAILSVSNDLHKHPPNHKFNFKGHEIGRKEMNQFAQAYVYQLNTLKKAFTNKRRKAPRSNSQINSLFYVSDQMVSFYTGADLGPLDPGAKKSKKLSSAITLLTEKHMATSGILTSLISRYVDQNSLKNENEPGRFTPDSRMKSALSSTNFSLHGEDLSKRKIPSDTPIEKAKKIKEHISQGKKSAFARIDGRKSKRSGEDVYDKKKGLMFLAMMIFNNYYRIPPQLLTDDEREFLKDEDNIEESKKLQEILSNITKYHHEN